jgi:hypothetical protein
LAIINIVNNEEEKTMSKLKPFKLPTEEPLKLTLDTIFDYADKDQAREVIFEPQRVEKPTEAEGIPMPMVPAGSVVLFVFYKFADRLEHQLTLDDFVKGVLIERLKKYQRNGWRIAFSHTELGETAIAYRA